MRSALSRSSKISGRSCRRWRDHLVEAICDELTRERRAELDAHLASCQGCAVELERLQATASFVDGALPPRPQGAELDVWNRIQPELDRIDRPVPRRLVLAYPAAASLAAILVALGLGLGVLMRPQAPVPVAERGAERKSSTSGQAVENPGGSPGEVDFVRYLERATPLLLAVANRQVGSSGLASFDPAAERRMAERLATDAEGLASRLEAEGHRRQASLVAELGAVFLQMANLPGREYRRGIEMVQATIESRALLFQLSVEEMRHL